MVKAHKRTEQRMAKKVLVTGAAGLIGREICRQLSNKFVVIGVDNNFRYPDFKPACTYIKTDLNEYLETALNDFDYVFHMAAINGTKYFYEIPNKLIENNFINDLNIFKFIEKKTDCKLIYASSSEVVSGTDIFPTPEVIDISIRNIHNPRWSYRLSKMLSENYLMNSSLNFLIVRFFNVFSKDSAPGHFIKDIIEKISENNYTLIGANETRSFCEVVDAVDALLYVCDKINKDVINIGSDEEITVLEAAEIIAEHFNQNIKWNCIPSRPGSVLRRNPDLNKLRSYYPNFSPKKFKESVKDL